MLRECVELCPQDLWHSTINEPPRAFWRIAYHAVFYTHFYLSPQSQDFVKWSKHVDHAVMTFADGDEPLPPSETLYSPEDMVSYIDLVSSQVDDLLAAVDLESPESGFEWYPNFAKLDHVLLNLRHLGIHVGQLQELLFARGLDPDWVSSQ